MLIFVLASFFMKLVTEPIVKMEWRAHKDPCVRVETNMVSTIILCFWARCHCDTMKLAWLWIRRWVHLTHVGVSGWCHHIVWMFEIPNSRTFEWNAAQLWRARWWRHRWRKDWKWRWKGGAGSSIVRTVAVLNNWLVVQLSFNSFNLKIIVLEGRIVIIHCDFCFYLLMERVMYIARKYLYRHCIKVLTTNCKVTCESVNKLKMMIILQLTNGEIFNLNQFIDVSKRD